MQLDKESHREIIRIALANMPFQGLLGDPDVLAKVTAAHEVLAALDQAPVGDGATREVYS